MKKTPFFLRFSDLFQQAFQMSGSLMSAKTQGRLVVQDTIEWLDQLGCLATNQAKECLREKSVEEMHAAVQRAVRFLISD